MKKVAFVFPGQGSQVVGMGKDIYETYSGAKKLFDLADQLLDRSLTELMFNGPEQELTKTEYAQPALLLLSSVIQQLLKERGVSPVMAAGHSLGEYSALVTAGSLHIQDALPLVHKRGKLMEQAVPEGQGTMAAVLAMDYQDVDEILTYVRDQSGEAVDIANLNCPGQIVISGTRTGVEEAGKLLKEKGAKRVLPLNVSGPFHSSLMKPAGEAFSAELNNVTITDASIPVYANVTASPVQNREKIEQLLVDQLYSPVRFEETVRAIKDAGIDAIVELGSGKVLTGLVKKIDRSITVFSVNDPESIEKFVQWYEEE